MKKNRVTKSCKVCGITFEVTRSLAHCYSTCSKLCSLKYRSACHTGRKIFWADKIRQAQLGKKWTDFTPEYCRNMREIALVRGYGQWMKGKTLSVETKQKIKASQLGHKRRGWKFSEETRRRMSDRARKGDKCNLWKGGVCPINAKIRSSFEYKAWRTRVFQRDDYTCRICGIRGGKLHADHILPFARYPELRLELDNGRTLCVPCHKETPTYLNSFKKNNVPVLA